MDDPELRRERERVKGNTVTHTEREKEGKK